MRKSAILLLSLALALPSFGATCVTDWNYVENGPIGPPRWGSLDLDWTACSAGRAQSPVIMRNMVLDNNLPLLNFSTSTSTFTVRNAGHDLKVYVDSPAWTLRRGTEVATLTQFHFHVKAEHLEGANAIRNDGEIHFVYATPSGKTVVVAVWITTGTANDGIGRILAAKPETSCTTRHSTSVIAIQNFIGNWNHYATYEGSLTTPPCGQNVTFLVLLEGITASSEQLAGLKLLATGNARPVQDINGRTIKWRQMP